MRSVYDVPSGATVFLRSGMDVPLAPDGSITDPARIEETRPTIDALRAKHCKIIVATHVGRPQGQDPAFSTKPIWHYLNQFYPTKHVAAVRGPLIHSALESLDAGELLVIENLRYEAGEENNESQFAEELVRECDVIVQDAYSNCHRDHASMTGVLRFKPGYAGLLLAKELRAMERMHAPEHPYVAIIGGAKADKIPTIKGLLDNVDAILLGGALANTFLKAEGFPVGSSKVDDTKLADAKSLLIRGKIILPIDAVVADRFAAEASASVRSIGDIGAGMILDIGPASAERYRLLLSKARTIVWAGPIGVFEWAPFAEGTKRIAEAVAAATDAGAFTLAAGGDSGAALVTLGYKDRVSHVSTGGGVTLQLLEGKPLPAIVALEENAKRSFA